MIYSVQVQSGKRCQVTFHMRILLHVQPIDFRKGIDGIAAGQQRYQKH